MRSESYWLDPGVLKGRRDERRMDGGERSIEGDERRGCARRPPFGGSKPPLVART